MTAALREKIFVLPPGADFADAFAKGFQQRYSGQAPEIRARTIILVNTGRARKMIEDALAALSPGPLPRLTLIPDLAADPALAPDQPLALAPLRRQLRLTGLVEQFLTAKYRAGETIAPVGAAADLAESLAMLIDQFHDSGVPPDTLDGLVDGSDLAEASARHWQQTLVFVDIVRRAWPGIRDELEQGRLDPRARQRIAIEALIEAWRTAPPKAPVLVVGSTGSVGSTAMLMQAVARLERGAVVLPGIDPETDPEIWREAGPEHPLGPFRKWIGDLDLAPCDLAPWHPTPAHSRQALLAQAMRPAPVTDHWHEAADTLRRDLDRALTGFGVIEAPSARHEAEAIALAAREALEEPETRISVVTPDAALARRVTSALARFNIVPDDTMGQPLAQSPPGILARLTLALAANPADRAVLSATLQHPLLTPGLPRHRHRIHARAYERAVLRRRQDAASSQQVPRWPGADADEAWWLNRIAEAIEPLATALAGRAKLTDLVPAHRLALERLSDADDGEGVGIWDGDAGIALLRFLDGLARDGDALGDGGVPDYPRLLSALMRDLQLRPKPREPHPRVALRGPREARFEDAHLTILAGLNDGIWPAAPDPGPWLSRPMHESLGLPLPERAVGLSAHDFLNAASRPRVLLTRSLRSEGAPTVASRWLIRLETLLKGIGAEDHWAKAKVEGERLLEIAEALATPAHKVPRANRPRPVPPRAALPTRLSVTDIERLVRDPYAVYAKRILGLRPLDPLERPADARERGIVLHRVMETFVWQTPDWPGADAAHRILLQIADEVLDETTPAADLRRAWRARIERFADWFIDEEAERRQDGAPVGAEVSGTMVLDLAQRQIEISAKADRIDKLHDGSAAIYDYKTGDPPSQKQVNLGFNHQLHLQAAILAKGGFDGLDALDASRGAYIGLTGRGDGGKKENFELDSGTIADHCANVQKLLDEYDAGLTWISRRMMERERWESDYDHLARRNEWETEDDP